MLEKVASFLIPKRVILSTLPRFSWLLAALDEDEKSREVGDVPNDTTIPSCQGSGLKNI